MKFQGESFREVLQGAEDMKRKNKTFEYFDYEPTNYRADRRGVFSGLIVLLIFVVGIVALD